jgi:DNA-binding transcriptional MerR regulator
MSSGKKLYYRIGEVARILDVEPSTLRFWEKEFKQLRPLKRHNERLYTPEDIELLKQIKFLLKEEKYTVEGARRQLAQRKGYLLRKQRLIEELEKMRDTLQQWRDQLD